MKHKNKKNSVKWKAENLGIVVFLILIFSFSAIQAQETISASGGNSFGSGGSVSYTVGQVFYQTYYETNGSIAEGVQQPNEILEVTAFEEANGNKLSVTVYPNPVTDYITLEVKDFDLTKLTYLLLDIQGKLVQNKKITTEQTSIVMSNLDPATYFLKITESNKEIKIFKIIKN